jgi:hypothetical protein
MTTRNAAARYRTSLDEYLEACRTGALDEPAASRLPTQQPREHAVPCIRCRQTTTWNVTAVCNGCTEQGAQQ